MITLFLTALLAVPCSGVVGAQNTAPESTGALQDGVVYYTVSDLTGADELLELRNAIVSDELPSSVRRASLDRYSEILKSGRVQGAADRLVESIRTFVQPPTPKNFKVVALSPSEISVSGTAAQRQWVSDFLDAVRTFDGQVLVEIEIYHVPRGTRGALLGEHSGKTLSVDELKKLEADIKALDTHELVTAPKLIVEAGSRATMSVMEEVAYIRDFEFTVKPDVIQELADPVVDVIQDGITIDVNVVPLGEDRLMVSTDFASSSLRRPIAQKTVTIGTGHEVTIQLPEVKKVKASAIFEVAENSAIVLSSVDPGFEEGEERDVLLLIRAKRVERDLADSDR